MTRMIRVMAAALVAVAVAGCGSNFGGLGGGDSAPQGSPSQGTPSQGSTASQQANWQAHQQQYDGMANMTYANELVVTADTGVYAYDRKTGKQLWTAQPPAAGSAQGAFCGSGQHPVAGKLSVGFGKLDPSDQSVDCTSVGVIDLRSGKMLWTSLMIPAGEASPVAGTADGMTTEISGSTVLAVWQGAGAAFNVSTGHRLWLQDFHVYSFEDLAVGKDGMFYGLLLNIDPFPDQFAMAIDRISPANGHVVSHLPLTGKMTQTGQPQTGAIVSTSPLTLLIGDAGDQANESFVMLDSTARHVTRVIPAGAQDTSQGGKGILYATQVSGNSHSHVSVNALVSGDTLFAVSAPGEGHNDYGLVAYDLTSGARRWSASEPGVEMASPVAVDGSAVVAVGSIFKGGVETDASVVRFSVASGAVLSDAPRTTGSGQVGQDIAFYRYNWADGRVYAFDWTQSPRQPDVPTTYTLPVTK